MPLNTRRSAVARGCLFKLKQAVLFRITFFADTGGPLDVFAVFAVIIVDEKRKSALFAFGSQRVEFPQRYCRFVDPAAGSMTDGKFG